MNRTAINALVEDATGRGQTLNLVEEVITMDIGVKVRDQVPTTF